MDAFLVIVGCVDNPLAVRRDGGRVVIALVVGEFGGVAAGRVDSPDGALHAGDDRFAVGRPFRRPRRRAGGRRQIVILHVLVAFFDGRVYEWIAVLLRAADTHLAEQE